MTSRDEKLLHEASKLHSEMAVQYIAWSLLIGFAAGVLFMWVIG
jgi:hypothetical protein